MVDVQVDAGLVVALAPLHPPLMIQHCTIYMVAHPVLVDIASPGARGLRAPKDSVQNFAGNLPSLRSLYLASVGDREPALQVHLVLERSCSGGGRACGCLGDQQARPT